MTVAGFSFLIASFCLVFSLLRARMATETPFGNRTEGSAVAARMQLCARPWTRAAPVGATLQGAPHACMPRATTRGPLELGRIYTAIFGTWPLYGLPLTLL